MIGARMLTLRDDSPVPGARILVVDDDQGVVEALQRSLRLGGLRPHGFTSARAALEALDELQPDVVIADYSMPELDGVEFLSVVLKKAPNTQRIMLTGEADREVVEEAIARCRVYRLLFKPWEPSRLLMTVRGALEQRAMALELERLHAMTQSRNVELEARVQERTQALSVAKREWEETFDTLANPIVVLDHGSLVARRANLAAVRVSDFPLQQLGRGAKCHEVLFGDAQRCEPCALEVDNHACELQRGERTWVLRAHAMAHGVTAVCALHDVTEERKLGRRLLETEKMSAIGHLAGGVAHEINNPLSAILGFTQMMRRERTRPAPDAEALEVIEESAKRCKRIVESLLKLSRRPRLEDRRPFDLSKCVEDTVTLFRGEARRHPKLALELDLADDLPELFGDATQLGQVVLNLLQNALQAIPEAVGVIRIATRVRGSGCAVAVSDTGTGIATKDLPHIFDPHFTTKPPGEGTGLGLAIVQRIVTDHGGTIEVETTEGRGTTFTVVLPVAERTSAQTVTKGAAA